MTGKPGRGATKARPARATKPPGPPPAQPSVARLRLQLAKLGNARYLSHLDVVRALLRSLRRAGLPLALSGGYNPSPKVAYGAALAIGVESEAEYVDVELAAPVDTVAAARRISDELPPGFHLRQVAAVPLGRPALASYAAVTRYTAAPRRDEAAEPSADRADGAAGPDELTRLEHAAAGLLGSETLPVQRRAGRRPIDLRPYLLSLDVRPAPPGSAAPGLEFELGSNARGAARADEVLALLGVDPVLWGIRKTDFWPLVDGSKTSPWQA